MTKQVILYTVAGGKVAIVHPSPEYSGTMEELAEQVVPLGAKFKFVDADSIPVDREYRAAWAVADADMDNKDKKSGLVKIDPVKKAAIDAAKTP